MAKFKYDAGCLCIYFSFLLLAISFFGCGSDSSSGPDDNNSQPNTVTDIDGNTYQVTTIGTQVWMAENLKVTHYRNGDAIPNVTDNTAWGDLVTGAYCNYNNDGGNGISYGRIYNWYAISDSRNIAPVGWRVATDGDWQTLVNYLGDHMTAGGKLKESGTTHWTSPNTGATNESGFTALPGGYRSGSSGGFSGIGDRAEFWCSTDTTSDAAWARTLYYNNIEIYRDGRDKGHGYSVRCIKE